MHRQGRQGRRRQDSHHTARRSTRPVRRQDSNRHPGGKPGLRRQGLQGRSIGRRRGSQPDRSEHPERRIRRNCHKRGHMAAARSHSRNSHEGADRQGPLRIAGAKPWCWRKGSANAYEI